jgi:multicomponent Na+:H+ antiporter subunit C
MIEQLAGSWNYIIVVILMMTGLFMVIARANLVKKMTAPILDGNPDTLYSNPLPHVLILTAIVVGVATTALGLALILRINEAFGSVEEDEIIAAKASQSLARPKRPTSEAAE